MSHLQVLAVHPGMVLTEVTRGLPYVIRVAQKVILGTLLLTPAQGEMCDHASSQPHPTLTLCHVQPSCFS